MIVKINDKYQIEVDTMNHTLQVFVPGGKIIEKGQYAGNTTKDHWDTVGYFPNIQQALRKVIFLESLTEDTHLEGYIERLERLDQKYKGGN